MIVLGIETSCDECSCSIVENGNRILSSVVATQIELHTPYLGVVPELASRLHIQWIDQVVKRSVKEAGLTLKDIDAIAYTNRPGLMGSLLVGVNFSKALAYGLNIPSIGIDHIRAHLYASQMEHPLEYPYLGLLVSGGHTVICIVESYDKVNVIGTTIDDAIGEAFDKVAKHYDMGYPGGVAIDNLSKKGNDKAYLFPGAKLNKKVHMFDISYSGLKTAVINQKDKFWDKFSEQSNENIAASFQRQAIGMLMKKVEEAIKYTNIRKLAAGGGVAANSLLREKLKNLKHVEVAFPSMKLCTDNGAMIAGLGYHYLVNNVTSGLDENAYARVKAFKKSSF